MRPEVRGPPLPRAPAGVGLYLFGNAACLYNFHATEMHVRWQGRPLTLPPHGPRWVEPR